MVRDLPPPPGRAGYCAWLPRRPGRGRVAQRAASPQLFGQDFTTEQTLRNWVRQGELDDGRRTDG